MNNNNPYSISIIDAVEYADKDKLLVVNANDLKLLCQHWQEQYNTVKAELDIYKQQNLLTIEEVMNKLHVSKCTLWRWNKNGILTNTKVGSRVLYKSSDIENVMLARIASNNK